MARKRDYAAEYARRQARARELGYAGYYERRVRAGAPPSAPKPTGERLRGLRGHASRADLERAVRSGRVAIISQVPGRRDPDTGRYLSVEFDVQLTDGSTRTYTLRGRQLDDRRIASLRDAVQDAGADVYVNPSVDVLSVAAPTGPVLDVELPDELEEIA